MSALNRILQSNDRYMLHHCADGVCLVQEDNEGLFWRVSEYQESEAALESWISGSFCLPCRQLEQITIESIMANLDASHAPERPIDLENLRLPIKGLRSLYDFLEHCVGYVLDTRVNGVALCRYRQPTWKYVAYEVSPRFKSVQDLNDWFMSYIGPLIDGEPVVIRREGNDFDPLEAYAELIFLEDFRNVIIKRVDPDSPGYVVAMVDGKAGQVKVISKPSATKRGAARWFVEHFKDGSATRYNLNLH